MPVSRITTERLAEGVAGTYAEAEVRLLRLVARHLERGADVPDWVDAKLAELGMLRGRARAIMAEATAQAKGQVADATHTAYRRGQAAAEGELEGLGRDTREVEPRHAERRVAALVAAQHAAMDGMDQRVVRQVTDAYQRAVSRAAAGTLTGAATRLQDAQVALDDLARQGVSGFVDRGGRRWELPTYVEMGTRTTTARASVAGHLERLEDAGLPLVLVSDSSDECELCAPWEGKVLSREAVTDAVMRDATTGEAMRVHIDGTVDEAMAAGLMHPNCTHNLTAYVPGATRRGQADSNPEGYAERQEQRALERKVREWKRREAVAITPEAQTKAKAKVRDWQGRVREHTDATGLPRKRNRERVGRGAVR